jgi:hypothetical protein
MTILERAQELMELLNASASSLSENEYLLAKAVEHYIFQEKLK